MLRDDVEIVDELRDLLLRGQAVFVEELGFLLRGDGAALLVADAEEFTDEGSAKFVLGGGRFTLTGVPFGCGRVLVLRLGCVGRFAGGRVLVLRFGSIG